MRARATTVPALLCLAAVLGCEAEIDHAAQRQHELIDHEYDRKEQLVDRLFEHWNATVDHHYDRHFELVGQLLEAEVALFEHVLEAGPPAGFGRSTCSFTSSPSGAEVFRQNLFHEWEYVGKTPLIVDRPLAHAEKIEVRASGYEPARGYMLSDEVHGPCQEHFELARR